MIKPSNGRCGSGRTILASTCASTLHSIICAVISAKEEKKGDGGTATESLQSRARAYRVLPSEHSTWPSSAPKEIECGLASRNSRPSRRRFWSSAARKKSFSGIEGDGGRMMI